MVNVWFVKPRPKKKEVPWPDSDSEEENDDLQSWDQFKVIANVLNRRKWFFSFCLFLVFSSECIYIYVAVLRTVFLHILMYISTCVSTIHSVNYWLSQRLPLLVIFYNWNTPFLMQFTPFSIPLFFIFPTQEGHTNKTRIEYFAYWIFRSLNKTLIE